jgi:2-octaprenyl-6-methoxyphenol hydroxylase
LFKQVLECYWKSEISLIASKENSADIAIVGGGLVGLAASLAASRLGHKVCLVAPAMAEADGRTSALLAESIKFLDALNIWDNLSQHAYGLKTMRIIDGTKRLFRAPQTDFNAGEIGLSEFGFNLENTFMAKVLNEALGSETNFKRVESLASGVETGLKDGNGNDIAAVETEDGNKITARIVFASDGRNSVIRKSLGIGERRWQYPQIALVGNFRHTLPHHDTSTEFHMETGPFTLVPLGEGRSSLVCVVDENKAAELKALGKAELDLNLERKMASVLGKVDLEKPLQSFPLSAMIAEHFSKDNCLLGGEAAHVFPPIGAQGLNLGLRDVAAFADLVRENGLTNPAGIAEKYSQMRSRDIHARTYSVDLLNRSLLSNMLPVQMTRSFGLYALGAFGPIRRLMMREGIGPTANGRLNAGS